MASIIINQNDVKNPLYPNLWREWLETLGIDLEATEIEVCLSSVDINKNIQE